MKIIKMLINVYKHIYTLQIENYFYVDMHINVHKR